MEASGYKEGWVCVTGAAGFVAGHVVEELLKHGYNVRATVRNPKANEKNKHLIELGKKYPDSKLELFAADLLKEGSFHDAIAGCSAVLHTASPLQPSSDPQRELVEPAVKGTLNVLRACRDGRVRKVVITSSVATIYNPKPKNGKTLTEADNNTTVSVNYGGYAFSKVEAEKAALKFMSELKDDEKFELATIHPAFVVGPQQSTTVTTSNQVVQLLLTGQYPLAPPLVFPTCDARDVAVAHRIALEHPKASGRYIVCNGSAWMLDMAKILKKKYPDYPIPSFQMPVFMLRLVSLFDKRVDKHMIDEGTQEKFPFDGTKIERELGFKYQYKLEQSLEHAAQSMIELGIVKKKKGGMSFATILIIIFIAVLAYYLFRLNIF